MNRNNKIKFWILIFVGILLSIIYILGQSMSLIDYNFTVSIGLQEPVEEVTEIGVALNKGFGLGDTLVYIPLLVLGLIGMIKRKFWGFLSMSGALAITVYWPIVGLSTVFFAKNAPEFNFTDYTSYSIILPLISFYGLWGLLYIYNNRKILIDE